MEEELFLWFLKSRARKLYITQASLVKKAIIISKEIIADKDINLGENERSAYTKFEGSNDWVEKFKKRYDIGSRSITTKCTQNIEDVKKSLETYFQDLNNKMEELNNPVVCNMDEVAIFFRVN